MGLVSSSCPLQVVVAKVRPSTQAAAYIGQGLKRGMALARAGHNTHTHNTTQHARGGRGAGGQGAGGVVQVIPYFTAKSLFLNFLTVLYHIANPI